MLKQRSREPLAHEVAQVLVNLGALGNSLWGELTKRGLRTRLDQAIVRAYVTMRTVSDRRISVATRVK